MRRLLIVLLVLSMTGCIRRYAAPEGPAPTSTPYAALALYLELELPLVPDAPPLPRAALRLALSGDAVFADAALIDGPAHAAITETWAGALALLVPRTEPIVLLTAAPTAAQCARLAALGDRVVVAARPAGGSLYPLREREDTTGSLDPLGATDLPAVCGAAVRP